MLKDVKNRNERVCRICWDDLYFLAVLFQFWIFLAKTTYDSLQKTISRFFPPFVEYVNSSCICVCSKTQKGRAFLLRPILVGPSFGPTVDWLTSRLLLHKPTINEGIWKRQAGDVFFVVFFLPTFQQGMKISYDMKKKVCQPTWVCLFFAQVPVCKSRKSLFRASHGMPSWAVATLTQSCSWDWVAVRHLPPRATWPGTVKGWFPFRGSNLMIKPVESGLSYFQSFITPRNKKDDNPNMIPDAFGQHPKKCKWYSWQFNLSKIS